VGDALYGVDCVGVIEGAFFAPQGCKSRIYRLSLGESPQFSYVGNNGLDDVLGDDNSRTGGGGIFYNVLAVLPESRAECGGRMIISRGEVGYYGAAAAYFPHKSRILAPSATDYRGRLDCVCTKADVSTGSLFRCPDVFGGRTYFNGGVNDRFSGPTPVTRDMISSLSRFTGAMDEIECTGEIPSHLKGEGFRRRVVPLSYTVPSSVARRVLNMESSGEYKRGRESLSVQMRGDVADVSIQGAHYDVPLDLLDGAAGMELSVLTQTSPTSTGDVTVSVDLKRDENPIERVIEKVCAVPNVTKLALLVRYEEGDEISVRSVQSLYTQGGTFWTHAAVDTDNDVMYVGSGNAALSSVDRYRESVPLANAFFQAWGEVVRANQAGQLGRRTEAAREMQRINKEYDAVVRSLSVKERSFFESAIHAVSISTGERLWARPTIGFDPFQLLGAFPGMTAVDSSMMIILSPPLATAANTMSVFDYDVNNVMLAENGDVVVGNKGGRYMRFTRDGEMLYSVLALPPAIDFVKGAPNNYGSSCLTSSRIENGEKQEYIVSVASPEMNPHYNLAHNMSDAPTGWMTVDKEPIPWMHTVMVSINAETGKVLWGKNLGPGRTTAVTCVSGTVLAPCPGQEKACIYDVVTGREMGRFDPGFSSRQDNHKDVNVLFDNNNAYVYSAMKGVYKYNVETHTMSVPVR
jgi:hypothetical protein